MRLFFASLLVVTGVALAAPSTGSASFHLATLPDAVYTDQTGASRPFVADVLQGRLVALNFVFTTCTTICPPMGAAFAQLQHLTAEQGLDVRFVSISIDPTTDTPPRLAAWAARFGGTSAWTLLTGPTASVNALLDALGARSSVKGDHLPVVVLGNAADGRWVRANALSPSKELLATLRDLARPRGP